METKQTTLRLPTALLDRAEALVGGGMRSRSDVIRVALGMGLDALERGGDAKARDDEALRLLREIHAHVVTVGE